MPSVSPPATMRQAVSPAALAVLAACCLSTVSGSTLSHRLLSRPGQRDVGTQMVEPEQAARGVSGFARYSEESPLRIDGAMVSFCHWVFRLSWCCGCNLNGYKYNK